MRRYEKTGMLPISSKEAHYITNPAISFHEAMTLVVNAQAIFDHLPAETRARFGNDPGALSEFMQNPENHDEAVKLGLRKDYKAPPGATQRPESDEVARGGASQPQNAKEPENGSKSPTGEAGGGTKGGEAQ